MTAPNEPTPDTTGADDAATVLDALDAADQLRPIDGWLVVLDFDGTLSPIVDRPDDAAPTDGAVEVVRQLAERTSVAIVSGRPVEDLTGRLGDLPVTLVGGHGAELRHPDGRTEHLLDVETVSATLDELEGRIRDLVDEEPGWLVERKDASLAVHHRLAPEDRVEELLPRVRALLESATPTPPGFEVLAGKAVEELRPRGIDKGRALGLLADAASDLRPLVVGDDVTDEDAFRVALARGGTAVLVAEQDRPSAAPYRLDDPDAVVALLSALLAGERER